jgi:hypothetical protein
MATGSSHSISMCPPHSPTRITKNSISKLSGASHCPNTSRIRFWAFSYSMGEPCGRSNQLITYFISRLLDELKSPERLLFGRAIQGTDGQACDAAFAWSTAGGAAGPSAAVLRGDWSLCRVRTPGRWPASLNSRRSPPRRRPPSPTAPRTGQTTGPHRLRRNTSEPPRGRTAIRPRCGSARTLT